MANASESWAKMTGDPQRLNNVTLLQRWCSAWADLLHADMALLEHHELPAKPSTVFHRRALWESAVISYGRCSVSDQKRDIPFKELVREATGDEGIALHERILDWRHGHVAHRKRSEFESVETVLAFPSGARNHAALRLVLSVQAEPEDDTGIVAAFEQHVKTVRDFMYENRVRPISKSVIADLNAGLLTLSELQPAADQSTRARLVITQNLLEVSATRRLD
ncbi:hypothetical protein [Mycolicibacter heraklionensis]|uniref:hypothetical protein n=1 Tax=Mycolicibacter heraklionensis TaxID=512402 RepID=UPI000A6315ED|nr:hypothetical protein [Mycolicibacter heraklionensis]